MTSGGVMTLQFVLKDDPLLRQEFLSCKSPQAVIEMCQKLSITVSKADLLRVEANFTLTLEDEQLERWFETPYCERVLVSVGTGTFS